LTNRYAEMRVRPVRDECEGVTISGTEYVMTLNEMVEFRRKLDDGIHRLTEAARNRELC
jgi:pyruvate-formate lyase-activating enzyme